MPPYANAWLFFCYCDFFLANAILCSIYYMVNNKLGAKKDQEGVRFELTKTQDYESARVEP